MLVGDTMKFKSILAIAVSCVLLVITVISCGDERAQHLPPLKKESLSNKPKLNMDEPTENFLTSPPSPSVPKEIAEKTQANEYVLEKNIPPRKDGNGVIVEKKDGMLITKFPNGEVYYLPDEL